ncbi:MAG: DNA translocase FtsK 4TM domain-containing protein, partial [Planctomycetota bacterium]|nr:DNA translocase FtsK 4TM domain-containing protein [Planctomycetota bacterium]
MGEPLDDESSARIRELGGLALVGISIWMLLSMVTFSTPLAAAPEGANLGGRLGHFLANGAFCAIGLSGYLLAILGIFWGAIVVARREIRMPMLRFLGVVCFVMSTAFVLDLGFGTDLDSRDAFFAAQNERSQAGGDAVMSTLSSDLPYGPGGWLAMVSNGGLVDRFGAIGLWVVLLTMSVISALLATEMAFYTAISAFAEWLEDRRERMGEHTVPAVVGWGKRLLVGIWDFLRGADLAPGLANGKKRGGKKAAAGAKRKSASRGKKNPLPDLDALDDVEDLEEEEGEEEYEYEYVDEDGNPVDPDELEEGEWEEEEWEEEYEEEIEVEEPEVIQPAAKKSRSRSKKKAAAEVDPEPELDFDEAEASAKAKR